MKKELKLDVRIEYDDSYDGNPWLLSCVDSSGFATALRFVNDKEVAKYLYTFASIATAMHMKEKK